MECCKSRKLEAHTQKNLAPRLKSLYLYICSQKSHWLRTACKDFTCCQSHTKHHFQIAQVTSIDCWRFTVGLCSMPNAKCKNTKEGPDFYEILWTHPSSEAAGSSISSTWSQEHHSPARKAKRVLNTFSASLKVKTHEWVLKAICYSTSQNMQKQFTPSLLKYNNDTKVKSAATWNLCQGTICQGGCTPVLKIQKNKRDTKP